MGNNLHGIIIGILATALLAAACEGVEQPLPESRLVVEGWIDSGGHPMVMVSETIPVRNGEIGAEDVVSSIAKWAKVTVSDGEQSVILTGNVDTEYYPPYIFSSPKITGVPGHTYRLEVEYKDFKAVAETTIPEPVPIDTLYPRVLKDSIYTVVCGFTDPPGKGDYYKAMTRTVGKDSRYMMSSLALASDEVFEGYSEMVLWNTQRLGDQLYFPNIKSGDEMWVKLCTLDSKTFSFWSNYEVNLATNFNAMYYFDSDMTSNVSGALGYWAGYGVSEAKITVP